MSYVRVLCCGGRNYNDQAFVDLKLDELRSTRAEKIAIIHGGARGADACCDSYGRRRGLPVAVVDANWNIYGNSAGPMRNGWMIELFNPQLVVAFPGGDGTANMIARAKAFSIPVWEPAK